MTVAELIEHLRRQPQDMEVCIAQPAHDYWQTIRAGEIRVVTTGTRNPDNLEALLDEGDPRYGDIADTLVVLR